MPPLCSTPPELRGLPLHETPRPLFFFPNLLLYVVAAIFKINKTYHIVLSHTLVRYNKNDDKSPRTMSASASSPSKKKICSEFLRPATVSLLGEWLCTSQISRPSSFQRCGWHWDCIIHFVNALCRPRNKLRVEVAGSGKILVRQFYFDHHTTVWDLRAQVLLRLDEGFDCRLFFGGQLEREWGVDENNTRLIEIIPTAVFTGKSATPAADGINLCVYASPMKRDDRKILLDMGCGRWAQKPSWDATSKEPLAKWQGVREAKGNALVKLDLSHCSLAG